MSFYLLILVLGAAILYFAVSNYLKSQPEKFNDMFGKVLGVVLAIVGFILLIRGQLVPGLALASGAVLSWQGSLWSYLRSRAGGGEIKSGVKDSMTREQALEILELSGNPTEEEIKEAHHRLMMKMHPDQGGSGYIATQLNQAKDLLLNK